MVWMQNWLDEVTIQHDMPGVIKGDSRGAIALTKNTKDHGKTSRKWDFTYSYFATLFLLKHLRSLTYTMEPKFPRICKVFSSKSK
jgi:hypothetical protein